MIDYCSQCGAEIDTEEESSGVFPPDLERMVLGRRRDDLLCDRCREEGDRILSAILE
jgi:hypothetical protein